MTGGILVTGAQGFLGRAFIAHVLNAGGSAIGYGRSERSDERYTHEISVNRSVVPALVPTNLSAPLASPNYEYVRGDLLDVDGLGRVIRTRRPQAIVHLAAALRDDDFDRLVRCNVSGTMALFEAIAASGTGVERVVIGSSCSVYGTPTEVPISETARCEPTDLYGASKLAAEHVAAIRSAKLDTRVSFARIFNVVGPGQDERHVCGRFASQAVSLENGCGEVIRVGDLRPTRDFIDVRDAASALFLLACAGHGPYNVCSQIETSIQTVLELVLRSAAPSQQPAWEETYRREGDIERHAGSNERLRELGWNPRCGLARSIEELVEYYRWMSRSPAVTGDTIRSVIARASAP